MESLSNCTYVSYSTTDSKSNQYPPPREKIPSADAHHRAPQLPSPPQFPASILEEGRRFLVRWKGEDASAGCSPRATRYFFRQIYSLRRTTFLPLPRMDESDSNFLKDATSFPPPRASRRAESTRAYKISYRGRLAKLERATNNLYSPTVLFFVELARTFPSSLSVSCPPQHEILNSLFK